MNLARLDMEQLHSLGENIATYFYDVVENELDDAEGYRPFQAYIDSFSAQGKKSKKRMQGIVKIGLSLLRDVSSATPEQFERFVEDATKRTVRFSHYCRSQTDEE